MKRVLTYGTFDTLHFGHIRLLKRAFDLGDQLYVGLSTDAFNLGKDKVSRFSWEQRKEDLEGVRYVHHVFPETSWEQKVDDIKTHDIDIFVMGDDWAGEFDFLKEHCSVVYLPRTPDISSTAIRNKLEAQAS